MSLLLGLSFGAAEATAEIPLGTFKEWDLSLDGRMNTFASNSFGDAQPISVPTWQGIEDRSGGTSHIAMTRIRSGFVTNVLGLTLKRPLTETTSLTGRFAFWVGISQSRTKPDTPTVDAREVYFKVEGPWGDVLAGRNLGLFGRGGTLLDYDIEHGFGLGHPCAIRAVMGGACGHAGHGSLFPGYNAGVVLGTPTVAGLKLQLGAFDPAANSERTYEVTPYPRLEVEATYHFKKHFHAFVEGLWQRLSSNTNSQQLADSVGFAYGAAGQLGPLTMGLSGYTGQGLGLYMPLENSPLFSDDSGVVRKTRGYLLLGSLTFGNSRIAGGAGVSILDKTVNEPAGPFPAQTVINRQVGISGGFYQTIKESLVLAVEFFQGTYDWYPVVDSTGGAPIRPRQVVNFVNVGATMIF